MLLDLFVVGLLKVDFDELVYLRLEYHEEFGLNFFGVLMVHGKYYENKAKIMSAKIFLICQQIPLLLVSLSSLLVF